MTYMYIRKMTLEAEPGTDQDLLARDILMGHCSYKHALNAESPLGGPGHAPRENCKNDLKRNMKEKKRDKD